MAAAPSGISRLSTGVMAAGGRFGYCFEVDRSRLLLPLLLAFAIGCPSADDDDTTPTDDDDDDDDVVLPASLNVPVFVTQNGAPLQGASILQGGGLVQGTTGTNGRFVALIDTTVASDVYVIAAMEGRRSVGVEIDFIPDADVPIELSPVEVDNVDFVFGAPGVDPMKSTAFCSHCHFRFVEQYNASAHRDAASDPQVHDVYAGTASLSEQGPCEDAGGRWLDGTLPGGDPGARCYLGAGLLPDATATCGEVGQLACDDPGLSAADQPTVFGGCADCHAPGIDGPAGGGHSLLDATGVAAAQGVHCDVCHKVADIDLSAPPGVGGRLVLGRPLEPGWTGGPEFLPVMYGPRPDVLNPLMRGAWSPIFSEAVFCAGCHQLDQAPLWEGTALDAARWPDGTLPIQSTYTEWEASINNPGTPCQVCHMLGTEAVNGADLDLLVGVEPGVVGGYLRPEGSVRSHAFEGALGATADGGVMLEEAALLTLETTAATDLEVTAELLNLGAGHAFPTGEPLRSLVLAIEATCDGAPMSQTAGSSITEIGGAFATATLGAGVDVDAQDATTLVWPGLELAPEIIEGLVVRAVRPTGAWIDYTGPAPFADGGFTVEQRGLAETTPVGQAAVVAAAAGSISLDSALALQAGDRLFVGHAVELPDTEDVARAWAGAAGLDFARVLAGADGSLNVPHYAAVDVVRDNRIPSYGSADVTVAFAWPTDCVAATVEARLLYRAYPFGLARERAWPTTDLVAASASTTQAR